ncbi:MAG TPA: rRNA maturation RNase YbeY [Armatimonadota bacterium]|jgi:probable rRNA maturation factor
MEITVRKTRPARLPRRRLTALTANLLRTEGWPDEAEVDLWLCTDDEIQTLNRDYRKLDKPTDVLSFPQYEPGERPAPGMPVHLGDVVISVDTAQRQADERGQSLGAEITWLFLHSVLHLIGYDDDTEEGLELMIAKATTLTKIS